MKQSNEPSKMKNLYLYSWFKHYCIFIQSEYIFNLL